MSAEKNSYFLLPFLNFSFNKQTFKEILKDYYFKNQNIPIHKCTDKDRSPQNFYQDDRGYPFLCQHIEGNIDTTSINSPAIAIIYLSGKFRLGYSITNGLHYDVQPKKGKSTITDIFKDSKGNNLRIKNQSHINIYPNDKIS